MDSIWEKALSLLRSEVNDQVYSAWFSCIVELSCSDSEIVLGVPNRFYENWIREKYFSLINNAVQQSSGKELKINFEVTDKLPTEKDPPANAVSLENPAVRSVPKEPASDQEKDPSKGWLQSVFGGRSVTEARDRDIGLNPNYTFENFVVGENNRFAHAAALAICEKLSKMYNPFFLYGGVGLGKTHLMQAMGHEILKNNPRAKVVYISSEEFTNQLISAIRKRTTPKFRGMYRNVDVLLIDDIQFIGGKESTQEEFFHTFNALHDAHKQIVLSSDRTPQDIPSLENRLESRFGWGLVADIQPPNFETRIAIMEKKSENEEVRVPKEVLFFLAENIKTNIREMEGALIRVVASAKLTGRDLTVEHAREVLGGMISSKDRKITIDIIQSTVADYFNIKVSDMKTKKRTRAIAYPRQLAMFLSRKLTDHSLPDIGGFFGRDHTTVLHACDKIGREISALPETKKIIAVLTDKLKG